MRNYIKSTLVIGENWRIYYCSESGSYKIVERGGYKDGGKGCRYLGVIDENALKDPKNPTIEEIEKAIVDYEYRSKSRIERIKKTTMFPKELLVCSECGLVGKEEDFRINKQKRRSAIYPRCNDCLLKERREQRKSARKRVLDFYGGKCACCGEGAYEFLAIDHINGGGKEERRLTKNSNIYDIVIKKGFPDTYRVLCHNCNQAIGFYGYCPHKNKHP